MPHAAAPTPRGHSGHIHSSAKSALEREFRSPRVKTLGSTRYAELTVRNRALGISVTIPCLVVLAAAIRGVVAIVSTGNGD
jgi:hypothetical protein